MGGRKEGRERGGKGRRQEEAVAVSVREDVEKVELMGKLCRNVLRRTGGCTSGKEAGAGLLLTGNSLPQLLLWLFMPIFRIILTPLCFHAHIPP